MKHTTFHGGNMLTITAENINLLAANFRLLRGKEETPSLVAQEVRNIVGSCCQHSTVYIGSAIIPDEDRRKDFYACKCCKQLFKDNPKTPVYGKPAEYMLSFFKKHGNFPMTLNNHAKKLGLQEPFIQKKVEQVAVR